MRRPQCSEPGVLVRREHGERRTGAGQHFIAVKDHLVLLMMECNPQMPERLRDLDIAALRVRFVIAIDVDRIDFELERERPNFVDRNAMPNDEAASVKLQRGMELLERGHDELDAAIGTILQPIEDRAIEHERAMDAPRIAQCRRKRCMVMIAQIAAEPAQRASIACHSMAGRRRQWIDAHCTRWAASWGVRKCRTMATVRAMFGRLCRSSDPTTIPPMAKTSVDLTHHFLIAMPSMADPHFVKSLTYVCEHTDQGALGIVVNKPIEMTLSKLFEQINIPLASEDLRATAVHYGGPVQIDRGFVLHRPVGAWHSTLAINDELGLTTSKDVLEAVGRGDGPEKVLVTLGYAGWTAGQLEQELGQNAWLTVKAEPDVMFDLPAADRLPAAMRLLGIDFSMLSEDVGHA